MYLDTGWRYQIRLIYLNIYLYQRHQFLCNKLLSHVNHKKVGISWFTMIRMSIVAVLLVRNAMPKLEKFNSNYTYFNWKLIYIVFINYQKL